MGRKHMSITIATLIAMAASAAVEAVPAIQDAVISLVRDSAKNGTIKTVAKCTDWEQVEKDIKDGVKAASDYVNYNDKQGGWAKK